ncbi:MAG TPA: endonuclease/exonuclease/phosphatase family protein, partial [Xanthobacteraceae bacterium]|nr:endonuclease/exonuclease/phosphatase family protein [Xanthobacteraceae bacterium]
SIDRTINALGDLGKAVAIVLVALAALIAAPPPAKADDDGGIRLVTQNMFVGSSFAPLSTAQSPLELAIAVATIYNNIVASKPAERAAAMARGIAQRRPDLVALQEVAILRTGTGGPATTVRSDFLQSLLDELAALGQRYSAVAIVPGLDAQAPSVLGFEVRISNQNAILVRSDLLGGAIKVSNLQIEQFGIKFAAPVLAGSVADARGWAAIDVNMRGSKFRFVTTHLDSIVPAIRIAQAGELLRTAANTSLPVIMAGDFNINANTSLDPSFLAYQAMINAGFTDAWQSKRAPDPGFTCCQAENLLNPASLLNERIDLVLFRGGFGVADISIIGNQQADRTSSGLWPSDHAGVAATLRLPSRQASNQ